MIFNLKLRSCFLAVLGSMILAFGLYNIHSISEICEGGVLGLTLLLEHHFSISPAISGLLLNALCYIIGWRCLGRNFIGYSLFAGGSFSLFYAIFEKFPPVFPQISEHLLLAAILGAVFVGVGVGISVRAGGAPSGDDALAMSISNFVRISIKWAYFISDITVLALSLTYIPPERLFYSLITVLLSGQIIDIIQKSNFKNRTEPAVSDSMRDVLVATLKSRGQLDIALGHRFYHIPAIRLHSGDFPLRYIAIYQSLHKFSDNPGIIYYGEIEKYALVKRKEITEIPRNSDELYYRFEIKEWKTLPERILPDGGDFVNLTTSLFLLTHSRTTSELSLGSAYEFELYRKIARLISGEVSDVVSESGRAHLKISDNKLTVFRNGRPFFSCALEDYKTSPLKNFRYIFRELNS